jgi:hypothetical protein
MPTSTLLKMTLFVCAFIAFMACAPTSDWTLAVKLYAAALTFAGVSFLA